MYYVVFSEDVEASGPLRAQTRPAHLERLEQLKQQGRLLVAENRRERTLGCGLQSSSVDRLRCSRTL